MVILSQAHSIHNVCKLLCLALKRRRLRKTAPAPKEKKNISLATWSRNWSFIHNCGDLNWKSLHVTVLRLAIPLHTSQTQACHHVWKRSQSFRKWYCTSWRHMVIEFHPWVISPTFFIGVQCHSRLRNIMPWFKMLHCSLAICVHIHQIGKR